MLDFLSENLIGHHFRGVTEMVVIIFIIVRFRIWISEA